jgi:hypothetical protein
VGVAVGALVDAPAGLFSAPRLLQPSSTLFAITFIKGAEGPHNNVWGNGKMESHVTTDSMADRPTGRQFGVDAPSIFRPQYSFLHAMAGCKNHHQFNLDTTTISLILRITMGLLALHTCSWINKYIADVYAWYMLDKIPNHAFSFKF